MYKFLTCFALTAVPLIGKPHCPFCDPAVLQKQAYYENDHAIALLTHKPIFPGHSLIIPKRHIERLEELTHEELLALFDLIKKVDHAVSKTFHTSTLPDRSEKWRRSRPKRPPHPLPLYLP